MDYLRKELKYLAPSYSPAQGKELLTAVQVFLFLQPLKLSAAELRL
jgi:hypothetical protein